MGKLIQKARRHLGAMLEETGDLVNPSYSYSKKEWLKNYYTLLTGKLYGKDRDSYFPGVSDILSFGLLYKAERGIQGLIKKKEKPDAEKESLAASPRKDSEPLVEMKLDQGVARVRVGKAAARFTNWVRTTCTKFAGGPYNSNPFKWALFTVLKLALNLTRVAVSLAVGALAIGPVLLARKVATVRAKRAAQGQEAPLPHGNLEEEPVVETQKSKTSWAKIHEVSKRNQVASVVDPVVVAKNRVDVNTGKRPEPKLMSELSDDYQLMPRKLVVEGKTFADKDEFSEYLKGVGFYSTKRGSDLARALESGRYDIEMENAKGDKPQRTIFRVKEDLLSLEPEPRDALYFVDPPAMSL